ncbi:MAG TPA: hypothetical protein VM204_03250 [Gaiellaceae bacterium]|nr:hypothetical protein [Gaiellaceae bacterium]
MNPNFRLAALIAASLGLVLSLFIALRDDDGQDGAATTAAATTHDGTPPTLEGIPADTAAGTDPATTEAPPDTTAAPEFVTVRVDVQGARPVGGVQRPSVRVGREVRLRVTSDVADHVHVHGYDLFAEVAPGQPAELTFVADTAGRFEIELEDRHVLIADLEVRP